VAVALGNLLVIQQVLEDQMAVVVLAEQGIVQIQTQDKGN
jgi:hypothetical protein